MTPKRRLFPGETEVRSLSTLTLTSHRVIVFRRGLFGYCSTAVLLGQVTGTTVLSRWGRVQLVVHTAGNSLGVSLDSTENNRVRSMADAIDSAGAGAATRVCDHALRGVGR